MTHSTAEPVPPVGSMPPDEFDGLALELGADGVWRAYSECGLVAHAPTFKELFERMGGVWQ